MEDLVWSGELAFAHVLLMLDALSVNTEPQRRVTRIEVIHVFGHSRLGQESLSFRGADYIIPGLPDVVGGRYQVYKLYTSDTVLSETGLVTVAVVGSPVHRTARIAFEDVLYGYLGPQYSFHTDVLDAALAAFPSA